MSSDFSQQQHHRQPSRSFVNTTMGAENSKPSSEVKQHVFSPYVCLCHPNGIYAPGQHHGDKELTSLRAVNTPSSSPMSSSIRCKRTLSYVIYGPEGIDGIWVLIDSSDRLHAITTTRTPIPGTPDRRAREAARAGDPELLQVQRNPVRRRRAVQRTFPRREDLRCHILQGDPRREATATRHEQE